MSTRKVIDQRTTDVVIADSISHDVVRQTIAGGQPSHVNISVLNPTLHSLIALGEASCYSLPSFIVNSKSVASFKRSLVSVDLSKFLVYAV